MPLGAVTPSDPWIECSSNSSKRLEYVRARNPTRRLLLDGEMATSDVLLDRNLTPDEKARFDRIKHQVWAIVSRSPVRVCEGFNEGNDRMIGFGGLSGQPLVMMSASRFLKASDDEVVSYLQKQVTS